MRRLREQYQLIREILIQCPICSQQNERTRMENLVAQFVGSAAPGQGFLVINDIPNGENAKSCATLALIEVLQGVVLDKQIEDEFKALAGKESTWRWYAKILNDNLFQMRFPTAKSLLTVSHFIEMRMRNVPSAVIKVKNGRMT